MKKLISGDEKYFYSTGCGCADTGKGISAELQRVFRRVGVLAAFLLTLAAGTAGAVEGLRLESLAPGELRVEWTAPILPPPHSYHVNWGPADEPFPALDDDRGNAYSTRTTVTLQFLNPGVKYQVRVREGTSPFGETVVQQVDDYHSGTQTRGTVAVGGFTEGRVASAGDVDWFAVRLGADKSYYVSLDGDAALGARLAGIYDKGGEAVEAEVEWSGMAALVLTPEEAGAYYVSVTGTDERTGGYTVSVEEGRPKGMITGLAVTSGERDVLTVSWDVPSPAPGNYRLSWAGLGENYRLWADDTGNAYPTGASHVLTGLDPDAAYKIRVRAYYGEGIHADDPWSGPWAGSYARTGGPAQTSGTQQPAQTGGTQQEDISVPRQGAVSTLPPPTITFIPEEEEGSAVTLQQVGEYECPSSCRNSAACTINSDKSNTCDTVFYATLDEQQGHIDNLVSLLLRLDGTRTVSGLTITLDCGTETDLRAGTGTCTCPGLCHQIVFNRWFDNGSPQLFRQDPPTPPNVSIIYFAGTLAYDLRHRVRGNQVMIDVGGDRCDGGDPSPNTCFYDGYGNYRTWSGESECECSFVDWLREINTR